MNGQHQASTATTCLLIVEAAPNTRPFIQQTFEGDHRLIFAQSADEALTALRQQTVDLVLVDMTGAQSSFAALLPMLRAERSSTELPVILISAQGDSKAAARGLQLGANDYVTPPLDGDTLRARVGTQITLRDTLNEPKQIITQLKFTQEMQENFSRIISHDLKGPLTNIRMAQFMLRDILRENREASTILDNMDLTLNGMVDMIRMFIDAMDSQQLEPHLQTLDSHDLLVETADQYSLSAERKNIRLTLYEDSSHMLVADQRMLRQVVGNLVSNAIKFSPRGTETRLKAEQRGDHVRISVADDGPGIPVDERGKLFTMFSKLSTRPTAGEASTGLGLWIVKELTRLQGGRAGVDHPAEGGSVFWVELPAASSA